MDARKQKRLEAAGWTATSVQEFLNLDAAGTAYIETKLSLSRLLRSVREKRHLTQTALAAVLNTSQSRVAKMERGDPSVSVDLLMQALFRLGVTRKEVARAVA
jgi:DNA-binding transcriptional regulator YiaG